MSKWSDRAFGDLYGTPSRNGIMAPKKVRGEGPRLVNMKEIFSFDVIAHQSMERAPIPGKSPEKFLLVEGDLLFARQSLTRAGAGKCSLVHSVPEPTTFESHIIRVRLNSAAADSRFFYHYFRSSLGRERMDTIVEQVAAAGIRASDLAMLPVPQPSLYEQQRIADVLGAFDDLIEANESVARRLDELARMEWRDISADLALARVGDEAVVVLGGTPARGVAEYWGGTIAWVNSGEANKFRVLSGSEGITAEGYARSSTKMMPVGSTLVAITGATLGQTTRLEVDACGNQSLVGVYPPGADPVLSAHLFLAISEDIEQLLRHATGGAQQHVNKGNVAEMVIPALDEDARARMLPVQETLDMIGPLLTEAADLARARDELIPLLMSGRVRVAEAEEALAAVSSNSLSEVS